MPRGEAFSVQRRARFSFLRVHLQKLVSRRKHTLGQIIISISAMPSLFSRVASNSKNAPDKLRLALRGLKEPVHGWCDATIKPLQTRLHGDSAHYVREKGFDSVNRKA